METHPRSILSRRGIAGDSQTRVCTLMCLPIIFNALNHVIIGEREPAVFSDSWGPLGSPKRRVRPEVVPHDSPHTQAPANGAVDGCPGLGMLLQARGQQGDSSHYCLPLETLSKVCCVVQFTMLLVDQLRWKSRRTHGEKHTNPE